MNRSESEQCSTAGSVTALSAQQRSVQVIPRQRCLKNPCTECCSWSAEPSSMCLMRLYWPHIQPLWLCSIPHSFPPVMQAKCTSNKKQSTALSPYISKGAKSLCKQEHSCAGYPAMKNKFLWPPSSLNPST